MESETYPRPIAPTHPPAAYIGGKRQLAKRLVALINATTHTTYAEVFVGMGGVFLKRTLQPKAEVINDYSGDVANLFRILQRHYPQFMDTLRFQVTGRREFERLKASDPSTLTDLERAARFLYLQRLAFGGKVAGRNFGVSVGIPGRFDLNKLGPQLGDLHERLAGVIIENLSWADFIDRYDRPETLFYLDPPYWGSEDDYGKELFARDQFALIAQRLAHLKGRFILSINDVPEIRALFARFTFDEVKLTYSVQGGIGQPARELVVTGGAS
jgi:DNA adenine methylase